MSKAVVPISLVMKILSQRIPDCRSDGMRTKRAATSVSSRHISGVGEIPPEILTPGSFCWCKFLNVVPAPLADIAVLS